MSDQNLGHDENGAQDDAMQQALIEEIMKHLDDESRKNVGRMSVIVDEKATKEKDYSSKCCNSYGRPANETVGLLDMYTDIASDKYDRE